MRQRLRGHAHDSGVVRTAISRWLDAHPAIRTVATFAALPGEPDLLPLVTLHPGHHWIYPRVEGDRLTLHPVRSPSCDLLPGAFGIREPSPALPAIPVDAIDAFLCPGLAFDRRGGRLGRGRGFYDRLLEHARPDAIKLGVAFPIQLVDDTFSEPHDIHMDEVLIGEALNPGL
jgi:5-formyltetrahydrofolate cyclo-ligase